MLAPRLRSPTATGAVQQVHIMVGIDSRPPRSVLARPFLASARSSHALGTSTVTAAPMNRPASSAGQIDRK